MNNFISDPLKHKYWDPTMGDYISDRVVQEDRLYFKRQKRKKALLVFLAVTHVILLTLIVMFY